MAKFWRCLGTVAACGFALVGCEDNPDQFYKQAPPGAGSKWNNGNTPPVYDSNAKNGFTDNFNTSSTDELCAGPVKHAKWADMVKAPIKPLSNFGGIDLRGGDTWPGLTFRAAQQTLCQATPDATQDDHLVAHWGDNSELTAHYLISNNIIDELDINPGFLGTMDFASRPDDISQKQFGHPNKFGQHTYSIAVGQTIRRDNQPWLLEWTSAKIPLWATEIYDALMYTFAPDLPSTQDNCKSTQLCRAIANTDGTGGFGARPLGMYFVVPTTTAAQPLQSQPNLLYAFPVKMMPFSLSTAYLKLDQEGPVATAAGIGDHKVDCVQKLGLKYSDFLTNCVNILDDQTKNKATVAKLLGGLAHTKEVYNLSVQGIDNDFASSIVGQDKVILDDWAPSPTDFVYHYNMDIRARGPLVNEMDKDLQNTLLQGTGLILREYQRRTQEDIVRMMKEWDPNFVEHKIGAPECMLPDGVDASTWGVGGAAAGHPGGGPAKGCTGFEQMVTPADPTTPDGPGVDAGVRRMSLGPDAQNLGYVSVLVPGDPSATFCVDPPPMSDPKLKNTGDACKTPDECFSHGCSGADGAKKCDPVPVGKEVGETCTVDVECRSRSCSGADGAKKCDDLFDAHGNPIKYFQHCGVDSETLGTTSTILDASYTRVRNYLTGDGDIRKLPPSLRDRKYYFQQLGYSMVKYLHAAANSPLPTNLAALGRLDHTDTDCSGKSCEPELDHLQFDQTGSSADQAKLEYIDRRFVGQGLEPLSFEYEIAIVSGNQTESRFRRFLERDEKAVFQAMSEDDSQPIANPKDNVRLTNIVGSPIVTGMGFKAVKTDPKKTAWYCATFLDGPKDDDGFASTGNPDPDCPLGPPTLSTRKDAKGNPLYDLDDNGHPIMAEYKGAFGETAFKIGTAHLKLVEEQPFIRSAKVAVPLFADPYTPDGTGTSAAGPKSVTVLPDWRPLAPGSGFRLPVNAQRDRFVPAPQVDFSGQNINMAIDYDLQSDKSMKILAVESQAFEGELFLCQDPLSGDLLHIRQYDSVAEVLDWMTAHPGAGDACQIIVRYSPFDDAPTIVTSKSAGVQVIVGQGVGIGRIVDTLVFDPSLSQ